MQRPEGPATHWEPQGRTQGQARLAPPRPRFLATHLPPWVPAKFPSCSTRSWGPTLTCTVPPLAWRASPLTRIPLSRRRLLSSVLPTGHLHAAPAMARTSLGTQPPLGIWSGGVLLVMGEQDNERGREAMPRPAAWYQKSKSFSVPGKPVEISASRKEDSTWALSPSGAVA